jgi:hypothetical protein
MILKKLLAPTGVPTLSLSLSLSLDLSAMERRSNAPLLRGSRPVKEKRREGEQGRKERRERKGGEGRKVAA